MKCIPVERPAQFLTRIAGVVQESPVFEQRARILALMGDPTRLRMLTALKHGQELCVCELSDLLGVSPSAVSQHLAKLSQAQLVERRRSGQTVFYRLARSCLAEPALRAWWHQLAEKKEPDKELA